jgi:oxaloacetate decarboxylase beta subunit
MKRFILVSAVIGILALMHVTFSLGQNDTLPKEDTTAVVTEEHGVEVVEEVAALVEDVEKSEAGRGVIEFLGYSGFANATPGHLLMILVGLFFIFLAIRYDYEPLLLIPIGVGILLGNVPFKLDSGLMLGIYEKGSVLNYLYFGVTSGIYPPLIFLGLGAMTDFSSLISNPRLMLLGAAAQLGIFATFLGAIALGFALPEAGAIGIIGGADGPTAIFLSSKLANGINILRMEPLLKTLSDQLPSPPIPIWPWFR